MPTLSKLTAQALLLPGMLAINTNAIADNKFYMQINAGAAFAQSYQTSSSGCLYSGASAYAGGCISWHANLKTTFDPGFLGSIALGYQIADQFRVEAEGMFQSNDIDKAFVSYSSRSFSFHNSYKLQGERERVAFLINGYFDFKNSTPFTPYITAGLGGYHLRMKYARRSYENDLDFAWQAGAGVNYALNDRVSFDLKYRYFGGTDAEIELPAPSGVAAANSSELIKVGDHQIVAGLRVNF